MRIILRSSAGFPVDISNADISVSIFDGVKGLVAPLNVEKVDPTNGTFAIYLSPEETALLPTTTTSSTLSWAAKITLNGTTTTLVKGQCSIREGFPL